MRYFSLPHEGLSAVLAGILDSGEVEAVLVPLAGGDGGSVRPALVSDPARLGSLDIDTPVSTVNLARILADTSRPEAGSRVAAVLRPCEVRALVELSKLRQSSLDRLVIVGIDCLGAASAGDAGDLTASPGEWRAALSRGEEGPGLADVSRELCGSCSDVEAPLAEIRVQTVGGGGQPLLAADGEWADKLAGLGLDETAEPAERARMIGDIRARRDEQRREVVAGAMTELAPHDRFLERFQTCLKCGNCREMCPICYCRQCVFETPDFVHDPGLYARWARRHGQLDVPSEVALFHMTRLNHMAVSCVGCGHCSSACPNDLPVATLFCALGQRARELFEYEPGRDPDEPHPFQTFKEEELEPR